MIKSTFTELLVRFPIIILMTLIAPTLHAQLISEASPVSASSTPAAQPGVTEPSDPQTTNHLKGIGPTTVLQGSTLTKEQDQKFNIPSSANAEWQNVCVNKSLNLNGDFQSIHSFLGMEGQWSVGPAVSTQLVKYDIAKKQAGFNTSVGAGASLRFYRPIQIKHDEDGTPVNKVYIGEVRTECRQSSFGGDRKSYLAAPIFSITPTLYATKPTNEGDLAVQPALLLGFFEDILNFGVGFNLTGPPGEKGNVFLLMSIGTGFKF